MKAAVYERYGPPEVLQLKVVPQPIPKASEVLVKIKSTTVNRTDCGFRRPEYLIVRLIAGLFKPRKKILGSEFSGEIAAIGNTVSKFKVGEQVFGLSTYKFGCHAEYICISESASIALKPSAMSHEEAGAVCDGLMLAINYIEKINFKTHPRILINGASGSIGSAAVQLAKYYGAHITAVCNTQNLELLKSLGADEVIDYTTNDFTKTGKYYDVVLDAVGKSTYFQCKQILKPNGIYFSSELGPWSQNIFLALWTPIFSNKKVKFPIPKDNQTDIEFFKAIIEAGYYKAVIDRIYDLEQIVVATQYVETGQKTGNVVIQI
jgi:NADPH:quinone reductase-like Zn-dependent oxidoreductase